MELNDVFSKMFEANSCLKLKAKFKAKLDLYLYKNDEEVSIDFNSLIFEKQLFGPANLIWYATCKNLNYLASKNNSENVYITFLKVGNDFKYETYVNDIKQDSKKVENLLK